MRIEHSRKHGSFDPRYPMIGHKAVPASLVRLGGESLDWQGFVARYFPDSRRHDSEALAGYEAYLNAAQEPPAEGSPAPALGEEGEPPATADTDRWETDGGASAARPQRRRRGGRSVGVQRV